MTQDDLAKRSGIDQTHISAIETGRRHASETTQQKLAAALGCLPSAIRWGPAKPKDPEEKEVTPDPKTWV